MKPTRQPRDAMIYSVTATPCTPEGLTLVGRVTQFGFFDVPMTFLVTSTVVPKPYPVRFTVREDETKKKPEITKGQITAEGIDITLFSPHKGAPTSLLFPAELLNLSDPPVSLMLLFTLSRIQDAKHFIFFAEFYEQAKPAPTQPAPAEGQA